MACVCSGCVDDGVCYDPSNADDCVCPDCANPNNPGAAFCTNNLGCNSDGICDPYRELFLR